MIHRLDFPVVEGQLCPPQLLADLRVIDESVELIHFGGGDWRLGSVVPSPERCTQGQKILDQLERLDHPNPKNILLGILAAQGFSQIEQYTATMGIDGTVTDSSGNPCTVLEDFRARDSEWRRDRGEAVFKERLEITLGTKKQAESDAKLRDYVHNDGRDHYRREMRGRKVFSTPDTGAAGSIILPFGR